MFQARVTQQNCCVVLGGHHAVCWPSSQLTEELDGLLGDHPNLTDAQRYQETLLSLQNLIHAKHLITTEEILKVETTPARRAPSRLETQIYIQKKHI